MGSLDSYAYAMTVFLKYNAMQVSPIQGFLVAVWIFLGFAIGHRIQFLLSVPRCSQGAIQALVV